MSTRTVTALSLLLLACSNQVSPAQPTSITASDLSGRYQVSTGSNIAIISLGGVGCSAGAIPVDGINETSTGIVFRGCLTQADESTLESSDAMILVGFNSPHWVPATLLLDRVPTGWEATLTYSQSELHLSLSR